MQLIFDDVIHWFHYHRLSIGVAFENHNRTHLFVAFGSCVHIHIYVYWLDQYIPVVLILFYFIIIHITTCHILSTLRSCGAIA